MKSNINKHRGFYSIQTEKLTTIKAENPYLQALQNAKQLVG
jgi:hypothetical protein